MARTTPDLTGQTYGQLLVLGRAEKTHDGKTQWNCLCSCGNEKVVRANSLRRGKTKSCGCLHSKQFQMLVTKHNFTTEANAEYAAWLNVKAKHDLPKEWIDFIQFFCDVGERPSLDHVLSRKDARLPHSKHNTYWRNKKHERAESGKLTTADLPQECVLDLRAHLRAAAAARQGAAAA